MLRPALALWVEKKWSSRRFLEEFPRKDCSRNNLDQLVTKSVNGLPKLIELLVAVVEGQ